MNAGPLLYMEKFLAKENSASYAPEMVSNFISTMEFFLDMCQQALSTNQNVIKPEQAEFHYNLMQGREKVEELQYF